MTQLNMDQLLWANESPNHVTLDTYPQIINTQTRPYIILDSKPTWTGTHNVTLVLWLNKSGSIEYSTHIALTQPDGTAELINGHYYQDLDAASRDYKDRE